MSAAAVPAVRALTCPNCGGTVALRAAGSTVSLICEHCGSTLDANEPRLGLIRKADEAFKRPRIALGTRGHLHGNDWEVVGYMERASEDGGWSEYLLFNPYRGYRFLIDAEGDFTFAVLLDRIPEDAGDGVLLDGDRYALEEEPYPARVTFVVGEFYWRVAVGETVTVSDFARGNAGLSREADGSEASWSLSRRSAPARRRRRSASRPADRPSDRPRCPSRPGAIISPAPRRRRRAASARWPASRSSPASR